MQQAGQLRAARTLARTQRRMGHSQQPRRIRPSACVRGTHMAHWACKHHQSLETLQPGMGSTIYSCDYMMQAALGLRSKFCTATGAHSKKASRSSCQVEKWGMYLASPTLCKAQGKSGTQRWKPVQDQEHAEQLSTCMADTDQATPRSNMCLHCCEIRVQPSRCDCHVSRSQA